MDVAGVEGHPGGHLPPLPWVLTPFATYAQNHRQGAQALVVQTTPMSCQEDQSKEPLEGLTQPPARPRLADSWPCDRHSPRPFLLIGWCPPVPQSVQLANGKAHSQAAPRGLNKPMSRPVGLPWTSCFRPLVSAHHMLLFQKPKSRTQWLAQPHTLTPPHPDPTSAPGSWSFAVTAVVHGPALLQLPPLQPTPALGLHVLTCKVGSRSSSSWASWGRQQRGERLPGGLCQEALFHVLAPL